MKDLLKLVKQLPKQTKPKMRDFTEEELAFLLDTRNSYATVVERLACARHRIVKTRREHGVIQ